MDRGKTDWPAIYYELVRMGCSPKDIPEMTYDQVNMLMGELGKRREKAGATINRLRGARSQYPAVQNVVLLNAD